MTHNDQLTQTGMFLVSKNEYVQVNRYQIKSNHLL